MSKTQSSETANKMKAFLLISLTTYSILNLVQILFFPALFVCQRISLENDRLLLKGSFYVSQVFRQMPQADHTLCAHRALKGLIARPCWRVSSIKTESESQIDIVFKKPVSCTMNVWVTGQGNVQAQKRRNSHFVPCHHIKC